MDSIRKYFLCLLAGLLTIIGLAGCNKHPVNGDLDGQWQVVNVTPEPSVIIYPERLYMCFSLHVCQLMGSDLGHHDSANMIYNEDERTLYLDFPYITTPESLARLAQYGIYSNPVTFDVELLSGNSLILRDGDVRVVLRRF